MRHYFGEPSPHQSLRPYPLDRAWTPPQAAMLASMLEATAPKPGNVHPAASFVDMHYGHFLQSAAVIGPVFERAASLGAGQLVLESVKATRTAVGRNTNLGMLLLFAPLAKAALRDSVERPLKSIFQWKQAVESELASLTPADATYVYEAIRHANPGGLGDAPKHNVQSDAPDCLIAAMREVAAVDAVARQYTNNFADIFDRLLPWLDEALTTESDLCHAICQVQLQWLAHEPDGLIVRKAGIAMAEQVQSLAAEVFAESEPGARRAKLLAFDDFLRSDGHRRNPGTTADLVAATLMLRLMLG